jgi:DNA-binding PadR family transcriptional regulator
MAKRRKVGNLLALAILATVSERPMHPYEMASVMKERAKDQSMKIHWGSLYTVVQNLEKHGFLEATATTRQGSRPERTVYAPTEAGRAELIDWLEELVGTPEREYSDFEAALSLIGILPPDRAGELLAARLTTLDANIVTAKAALAAVPDSLPRVFVIEAEYRVAIVEAEANWIRGLLTELRDGTLPGLELWRLFHAGGDVPPELREQVERGYDQS